MRSLLRLPLSLLSVALLVAFARGEEVPQGVEVDPLHVEKMKAGLELFEQQVSGIFAKHCVDCHGGDEVESGFDLATRKAMLRGGSKGPAVKPGKAEESRLIALISHNEDPHMPEGGDKLSAAEIAAITRWIDLGAPYAKPLVENPRDPDLWVNTVVPEKARDFWAFRPLASPAIPSVKKPEWAQSPIDAFILAKLEEKGLSPNEPVDRRRLIRRAYFDLLGLPPAPEAVEAFVKSEDPQAYEQLLDQLLANPHFGERWGRYWLDVARFAESHGFEQDYDRPHAYHFRDFVIEALNSDLPYDQFVKWQLAGDELAPDNILALKATGFLGAGVFPTQITANEVERTRYDALDDMAATTGTAFLGLTIGCARCHDHKFDPLPQADYYRFTSSFTTTVRGNVDVKLDPRGDEQALNAWQAEHDKLAGQLAKFEQEQLPNLLAKWESERATTGVKFGWQTLAITDCKSAGGATLTKLDDDSWLASGTNPDFDTYTFNAKVDPRTIRSIRLEALAHPSFVKGGPGRAGNGNIALTNFTIKAKLPDGAEQLLALGNPRATFEQKPHLLVKNAIDADEKSAWALDPQFGKDHAAAFDVEPLDASEATLTFTLAFQNNRQHNIGRYRVSIASDLDLPLQGESLSTPIAAILAKPAESRSPDEQRQLLQWYRHRDPAWQAANKPVADHLSARPKPKTMSVMVCSEGITPIRHHTQGADFFNEFYFLKRGDCNQKQGLASQGFLQVLMRSPDREKTWLVSPPKDSKLSYRRTALANWLTDSKQGAGDLLARVMVNRLWQGHFGRGLVSTANDFGKQGRLPSHPELLEWLALDFQANGWKMKRIHKAIMLSSAYRQSSVAREDALRLDPENEFLWRHAPKRLEAEAIRDTVLAVAGDLDETLYGPGTLDEAHKRRSIYFTIKRSKLIPFLQLFDQPEPLVGVGSRPSTTVAPQALAFMNSPRVRQCAISLATRISKLAGEDRNQLITHAYRLTLSREPDAQERELAAKFLEQQTSAYQEAKKGNAAQVALTDFCQALFGLNEFIFIE